MQAMDMATTDLINTPLRQAESNIWQYVGFVSTVFGACRTQKSIQLETVSSNDETREQRQFRGDIPRCT